MVYHMLAVFGEETARPPAGLDELSPHRPHHILSEEEQKQHNDACRALLEKCYSACKSSIKKLELLGLGSGFSFEASPYSSYACRGDVHVLFAGEVSEWPGVNAVSAAHDAFVRNTPPLEEDDAHWLLDFYDTFPDATTEDIQEQALQCLSQINGSFAFVIYDAARRRVLAARDPAGAQPLFWGATPDGQLMFGSCLEDLAACNPTATSFPPGTLFASERHMMAYSPGDKGWVIEGTEDYPGQLLSFLKADAEHWRTVKAIPRITSKGVMCGAVYKVASQPDIASA